MKTSIIMAVFLMMTRQLVVAHKGKLADNVIVQFQAGDDIQATICNFL